MQAMTEAVVRFDGMSAYQLARLYQWTCGKCGSVSNSRVDDSQCNVTYRTCPVCHTRNRIVMIPRR